MCSSDLFDTEELIKILEKIVGKPVAPKEPAEIKQTVASVLPEKKPASALHIPQPMKSGWFTKKKMIVLGIVVLLGIVGYIYDYQGSSIDPVSDSLTGVWSGSDGFIYEFHQIADKISLIGRDINQTPIVQGEGVIQGQQISIRYKSIDNTWGRITLIITPNRSEERSCRERV